MSVPEGRWFERALELAERGRGKVARPPARRRGPRARRRGRRARAGTSTTSSATPRSAALERAGERARGATLYVTLEPCSHHGRTPPCADAVVAAGIAKAVVGALDPNPQVDGRGVARLREAGVEVELLDSVGGAPPERGLAHVEGARAPVRDVQGRGHARRAGRRPRRALGHRRGVPTARARAARGRRRRGGRHGHRARGRAAARRARGRTRPGNRAGSPSGAARSRTARSSSCAPARSRRSCARSPPRASSRSCSRAARHSRPPSWRPGSWTSCSSSSRPTLAGTAPRFLGDLSAPLPLSRLEARRVGGDVLLEAYVQEL